MDPSHKAFAAICGGVLLAAAGIVTWLVLRGKKRERAQAEHDAAMRARMPETPSQRPESTSSATSSSFDEGTSEPPEPTASESSAGEPEPTSSEPVGPLISVGNRRHLYKVPPGAVIDIKAPRLNRPGGYTLTRADVKFEKLDGGAPDHLRFRLVGAPGPIGLTLIEEADSKQKRRVVASWKFELVAA